VNEPIYPYVLEPAAPDRPAPVPLEAPAGPQQWNDWARASLFDRRTVLLEGPTDAATAAALTSELMLLESDGGEPIELRIDSGRGELDAAITLVDVIGLLGAPVHATVVGRAEGPALAVLAVCSRRVAAPHARLRFGADELRAEGRAADVVARVERQREQIRSLATRLAAFGPLDAAELEDKIVRREPLSLDDAVAWGLLDAVAEPEGRVLRLPRPVGYQPPR
jgi:ATP-dependent Clp protease protease subunit